MIRSAARALIWATLDALAHFLYSPTMMGRRSARARWHHNIHLIPRSVLGAVCDRYDLHLGLVSGDPVDVTGPDGFGCAHMQIWSPNLSGQPTFSCGCDAQPLWRTRVM